MGSADKLTSIAGAEAFQFLPPAGVRAVQVGRLRRMLEFCEQRVPLYRELYRKAGVSARDVRSLGDLRHFPTVTREQLAAATPDALRFREPTAQDVVFSAVDPSGVRVEVAWSAHAVARLDAMYARALFAWGYRPWHRMAHFTADASSEQARRGRLMQKHALPLDADPHEQLRLLIELQPDWIQAYPSILTRIARVARRRAADALRPRGIICHGEVLHPELRVEIADVFGCPVSTHYGTTELHRIGWTCVRATEAMHVDADGVVIEAVRGQRSVAVGEEGDLLVTGLVNRLMPLVRFHVGDRGRLRAGRCECGRGLPLFEVTDGRADDVLTLRDGRRVNAPRLLSRLEKLEGLSHYRVVQTAPDRVDVLAVWESGGPPDAPRALRTALHDVLGPAVDVTLRDVADIPPDPRCHFRKVVCESESG